MEQTWDIASLPERDRLAYWREVVCRAFIDLSPESRSERPFEGRIRSRSLAGIPVSDVVSSPQLVRRTPADIAHSPAERYYVNLQVSGTGRVRQDGREAALGPGDLVLVDCTRPFEMEFDGDFHQLAFHLDHRLLAPRLPDPTLASAVRVGGETPLGRLVSGYLVSAAAIADEADEPAREAAAAHVPDLLAAALLSRWPGDRPGSPVRAARREAALAAIERRLADPALRPALVAAELRISTRYLHTLLAEAGLAFERHVLERRLARCHEQLVSQAFAGRTVTDIAFGWGFNDLSHFGRAFRRRYGATPTELRRHHAG